MSTDALHLLEETYMQICGIAHIPPGWTIPFGIPFPPLLQKRTKISEPFVWITSARLPAKKKMENLVAFYGWYNSIPLLFLVPKKNYHLSLTENFHLDLRISVCILANRCFPFDWVGKNNVRTIFKFSHFIYITIHSLKSFNVWKAYSKYLWI